MATTHAAPDVVQTLGLDGATGRRRRWRRGLALGLGTLLIATAILVWIIARDHGAPQYQTQEVLRGHLTVTVMATGNLEPTNQVDVGSELSGIIRSVAVDYNDRVQVGQVLATLDTDQLQAKMLQSKAGLTSAQAEVIEAQATDDDFSVRDMKEIAEMLSGTTRVLTALLVAVAAVSLLVGGIGIMNIMLVSVTERTREIGIRLAIGALERDVWTQFLVEAVVLSSFGGVFGIALAVVTSVGLARVLQVPFVFNPGIVGIACFFSAAVGVVFGYFPARQAARLDPIDTLRHE